MTSIMSAQCKGQIAAILTTPAVRDRLIVNMLQGAFQQDNAYSRLDAYLTEFETGLALA